MTFQEKETAAVLGSGEVLKSECVDCFFDLFGDVLGNDLLGNDQIKDLSASLLIEEFDRILHQIRCLRFDDLRALGIIKAFFYGHTSEIHDSYSLSVRCSNRKIILSIFETILAQFCPVVNRKCGNHGFSTAHAIHGGGGDAARIAGAFPAWVKPADRRGERFIPKNAYR